jgi:PII-like signaling protein
MKEQFLARMLSVYLNEDDSCEGKPLLDAILEECRSMGLAGAIAR